MAAAYHGLAFNIDMDLEPFRRINPCGYAGLEVTQLSAFVKVPLAEVEDRLVSSLQKQLEYSELVGDWPRECHGMSEQDRQRDRISIRVTGAGGAGRQGSWAPTRWRATRRNSTRRRRACASRRGSGFACQRATPCRT